MRSKGKKEKTAQKELRIKGTAISSGVVVGNIFFFTAKDSSAPEFYVSIDDVDHEITRYGRALDAAQNDLQKLQKALKGEKIKEGADILEAHLQIMNDPLITEAVEQKIRETRRNAESVFHAVIEDFREKFHAMDDPYFRERFKDVQDISKRVMAHLNKTVHHSLSEVPDGSVVFVHDLSASHVSEAKKGTLKAFVTEHGGATSHAAIVAKAKGIPYITDIDIAQFENMKGATVIVDGRHGDVIVHPTEATLSFYRLLVDSLHKQHEILEKNCQAPAETLDGHAIHLSANLDTISDLPLLKSYGCHKIGLLRSEYLFLTEEKLPPEEGQYRIYCEIIKQLKGFPIVIRTFDVGGDKNFSGQQETKGPLFLGCRALRYLLSEPTIFKAQLAALSRAALFGDVRLLLPMVTSLTELRQAKELIREVQEELKSKGVPFKEEIPIGCMIEVPAAALIADLLIKECDFLSIGTNDLIQYTLAVDRGNNDLQQYYTPAHPAVLRLIKHVVEEAECQGSRLSICGEIAADPRFTLLLIGLGVKELSMAPRFIPAVKSAIRSCTFHEAENLARDLLQLSTSTEVLTKLEENQPILNK